MSCLCESPLSPHLAGAYYLDGEPGLSFIAKETETLTKVREYTPERIAALQPDVFVVISKLHIGKCNGIILWNRCTLCRSFKFRLL